MSDQTRTIAVTMSAVHWAAYDKILASFCEGDDDHQPQSPAEATGRLLGTIVGAIARQAVRDCTAAQGGVPAADQD